MNSNPYHSGSRLSATAELHRVVGDAVESGGLLPPGSGFLVAVSGGRDSMVLLDGLHSLGGARHWRMVVAHFNHRLRGEESDRDAAFVAAAAHRYGLKIVSGEGEVRQWAREHRISLEMAARNLRHAFLADSAKSQGVNKIVLAHHADDQIETFLLRALRGSGAAGLGGMRVHSPSPADPEIALVRPLLRVPGRCLDAYARENRLDFREDCTNQSHAALRNRLRHRIIPAIRSQFGEDPWIGILRSMEILAAEGDCIAEVARAWLRERTPDYDALPTAVQREVLRHQGRTLGRELDFTHLEHLRRNPEATICLAPEDYWKRTSAGELIRHCPASPVPEPSPCLSVVQADLTKVEGSFCFGRLEVSWRIESGGEAHIQRYRSRPNGEVMDADKVGPRLELRGWKPGDRMQPLGLTGHAKLQDLFVNAKIPVSERRLRVVAARTGGEILWVEGLRIAESVKVDRQTRRCLLWQWNYITR